MVLDLCVVPAVSSPGLPALALRKCSAASVSWSERLLRRSSRICLTSLAPIFSKRLAHTRSFSCSPVGTCWAILEAMGSRATRIAGTLALLACLVCPLLEMFDTWDHTLQTGNDTEYTVVVLALCVGVAYSFARFVFKCSLKGSLAVVFADIQNSFLSAVVRFTSSRFAEISPPPLALRI